MNKLVVITGSSRGIGLELVKKYVALGGYSVYACCRTNPGQLVEIQKEHTSTVTIVPNVDVSQPDGLASLKSAVADLKVDLLINNAGILYVDNADTLTLTESDTDSTQQVEQMKEQFAVITALIKYCAASVHWLPCWLPECLQEL